MTLTEQEEQPMPTEEAIFLNDTDPIPARSVIVVLGGRDVSSVQLLPMSGDGGPIHGYWHGVPMGTPAHVDFNGSRFTITIESQPLCADCDQAQLLDPAPGEWNHRECNGGRGFVSTWEAPPSPDTTIRATQEKSGRAAYEQMVRAAEEGG